MDCHVVVDFLQESRHAHVLTSDFPVTCIVISLFSTLYKHLDDPLGSNDNKHQNLIWCAAYEDAKGEN